MSALRLGFNWQASSQGSQLSSIVAFCRVSKRNTRRPFWQTFSFFRFFFLFLFIREVFLCECFQFYTTRNDLPATRPPPHLPPTLPPSFSLNPPFFPPSPRERRFTNSSCGHRLLIRRGPEVQMRRELVRVCCVWLVALLLLFWGGKPLVAGLRCKM